MINVILHGCRGRMGRAITDQIDTMDDMMIVAGVDRSTKGMDQQNPGTQGSYPIYTTLALCKEECDIIIDFSNHEAIPGVISYAIQKQLPVVLAATGLSQLEKDQIVQAGEKIPILWAPNFSLGINVIVECLRAMMPALENGFDVQIIEKHHTEKKDAPSGTAILLADTLQNSSQSHQSIEIHALRAGTIPGEHTVLFAGRDEIIEITHTAMSRDIFASGALHAARFLVTQPIGTYHMSDVINNSKK